MKEARPRTLGPFLMAVTMAGLGLLTSWQALAEPGGARYQPVHAFDRMHGEYPSGSLVEGDDGYLYGTASSGGRDDCGVIFKVSPKGKYKVVHDSRRRKGSPCNPEGGLMRASDGNFYGTAGSAMHGNGTVFSMTPAGQVTTLHVFGSRGREGACLMDTLVEGDDKRLYGVARCGGEPYTELGTIFSIAGTGDFKVVHTFTAAGDGAGYPVGPLVKGSNGKLYGVAEGGGEYLGGTFFSLDPGGVVRHLHSFSSREGERPWGGLMLASDGRFYGTTRFGGAGGQGTIFSATPDGAVQVVHSFDVSQDGAEPMASLVEGPDGTLLGSTTVGGSEWEGTLFRVGPLGNPASTFELLHVCGTQIPAETDCQRPASPLLRAGNGHYYGLAMFGGGDGSSGDSGSVFSLKLR